MAKVYSLPKELEAKLPKPDYSNYNHEKEEKEEKEFLDIVKNWAIERNPTDKYAGVEYYIPMGDGVAQYIVLSTKPLALVHLPLGDAWDSPWADRVKKSDIVAFANRKKLFANSLDKQT
jgi:hypothetical protein